MTIIITTDVERAARRTDRTLRLGEGDVLGAEARALAERLGVRIVGPDGTVVVSPAPPVAQPAPPSAAGAPAAARPAASVPPIQFATPAPAPNPVEAARPSSGQPTEPEASWKPAPNPVEALRRAMATPPEPASTSSPAPNPVEVLQRQAARPSGEQPRDLGPAAVPPLPLERYGAGQVLDPVREIGRPAPQPASPPPPVRPLSEAPPSAAPAAAATVLPVQRIPVATPVEPTPGQGAAPSSATLAAPSPPSPTLVSSRRPPSYRQRRRVARLSTAGSQMGVLLGRVIDSREVRRAAEAGVRLVRIGPEAYVTRSARRAAAMLGVVLYPDSSLSEVDDRTKAGNVLNPISREPAITRHGAGIVRPGGIPIGGDHVPGTLGAEEPV